mgnify:CR=1 FL=1
MTTIKFNEKFALEFSVKKGCLSTVERILTNNMIAYNSVAMVFNGLTEFTCYDVNTKQVEMLRKLFKDEKVITY